MSEKEEPKKKPFGVGDPIVIYSKGFTIEGKILSTEANMLSGEDDLYTMLVVFLDKRGYSRTSFFKADGTSQSGDYIRHRTGPSLLYKCVYIDGTTDHWHDDPIPFYTDLKSVGYMKAEVEEQKFGKIEYCAYTIVA